MNKLVLLQTTKAQVHCSVLFSTPPSSQGPKNQKRTCDPNQANPPPPPGGGGGETWAALCMTGQMVAAPFYWHDPLIHRTWHPKGPGSSQGQRKSLLVRGAQRSKLLYMHVVVVFSAGIKLSSSSLWPTLLDLFSILESSAYKVSTYCSHPGMYTAVAQMRPNQRHC